MTKILGGFEITFWPLEFDDPQGNLAKCTRTNTIVEYQWSFESLSNRVVGSNESFLISCFISGLKPYLKRGI